MPSVSATAIHCQALWMTAGWPMNNGFSTSVSLSAAKAARSVLQKRHLMAAALIVSPQTGQALPSSLIGWRDAESIEVQAHAWKARDPAFGGARLVHKMDARVRASGDDSAFLEPFAPRCAVIHGPREQCSGIARGIGPAGCNLVPVETELQRGRSEREVAVVIDESAGGHGTVILQVRQLQQLVDLGPSRKAA